MAQIAQINEAEQIAIQKLYASIKDEFKVVKMVLFGSKARGDAKEYSDIDLLVLTENSGDTKEFYKMLDVASGISIDHDVIIDCLYMNYKDWELESDVVNPLLKKNIEREGVEIVLH